MHSELTHGGEKARRSHRVLGWDRPSPGGQGEEAAPVARPRPSPAPDGPGSHAHILPDARRPPAAGVGAGSWNWSGPRVPRSSPGPQKGLQLTSPATGSSPPSILSALQSKRLTFMGGGQAMEASPQPAGEAGGSGKGRVPAAPALLL